MAAELGVQRAADWSFIRYASVWEDADVLCEALRPTVADGRILSIASAGDNVLAMLTLDPAEVVAADLNPAQLAALELRIVAFRQLDDQALDAFLGLRGGVDRIAVYRALRGALGAGARAYWDAHADAVAEGIVHVGKFERYLRGFRRRVLPWVHPERRIEALRLERGRAGREAFYRDEWDGWRWRLLFRAFFSRAVMGRMGRDPTFFSHVRGSVGERFLERTRHALTELPVRTNPYLAYIMTGNYPAEARPRYLRAEHRDAIRGRLDRVRIEHGPVEAAGEGSYDGFNLSDIFEYMSPVEHRAVYAALVDRARPGARMVYWNLLVDRRRPDAERGRVRPLTELAAMLKARDQAWFYGALHVDEVAWG